MAADGLSPLEAVVAAADRRKEASAKEYVASRDFADAIRRALAAGFSMADVERVLGIDPPDRRRVWRYLRQYPADDDA